MTQNKFIASILGTLSIVILFIVFSLMFDSLSPLTKGNPQAQAVLENSQQTVQTTFNWWLIADSIGGFILFGGLIFGVVKLVMKIAEDNRGFNSGGFY